MAPPMLDRFLGEIKQILESKDAEKLRQYLIIEPPFSESYNAIIKELRQFYPAGSQSQLETKIESTLPEYEGDGGGSWPAFVNFLLQYFAFVRDVDTSKLVETHEQIKSLVSHSVLALSDATMGIVVLPTVIALSKQLSRLSIGLEKHPELHPRTEKKDEERVTLVESSANTIREAFSKCLSERSAGPIDAPGRPAGRRVGIYLLANICLRLFFHARKLRSAEQIFGNIYAQSPPLSRFPASQRVTFLYYLGRYFFANNHFFRAQAALHEAYVQCPKTCLAQRRQILVPLIAANITLGRFPSAKLLARPEATSTTGGGSGPVSLSDIFLPICNSIRTGNLSAFRASLDQSGPVGQWLLSRRVLLQLQNRGEVLVWRSLARRVFLLAGFKGDEGRSAPRLDVEELRAVVQALSNVLPGNAPPVDYVDEDFEGCESEDGEEEDGDGEDEDEDGEGFGEKPDEEDQRESYEDQVPGYLEFDDVEASVASLVRQGLLHGYMSHKHGKFVITGAKARPAVEAGFPPVWEHVKGLADKEVPGWVTETMNGRPKAGGRVVNLTGVARPVGVGA